MRNKIIICAGVAILLTGCIDGFINSEDIYSLIKKSDLEAEKTVGRTVKIDIPIIPKLVIKPYIAEGARDPFVVPDVLSLVFIKADTTGGAGSIIARKLPQDPERPVGYISEPLEEIPLKSITMKGVLGLASGKPTALVDTGAGDLIVVKIGDYVGENFGKIVNITEQMIELSEIYGAREGSEKQWERFPAFINLSVEK